GISALNPQDIALAEDACQVWKLIGRVEKNQDQVTASVSAVRLPLSHPLAAVNGATNALTFSTDLLGDITLIGAGAGRLETGYAILGDLLAIHRHALLRAV